MDINELRSLMTLVSLITFLGIVVWAYSRKRKAAFDAAAYSVFDEEDADRVDTHREAATRAAGKGV